MAAAALISGSHAQSQTFTTLYSFSAESSGTNSDGARPYAGLVQGSDGSFYGTTPGGGNGSGTVFQITASGSLTTLYSFSAESSRTNSDGAAPYAGLVQGSDGNLYGTTESGGVNGTGTVFQITTSGSLTTLYSFSALSSGTNPDGAFPYAGLVQGSDGNFYGTANDGGSNGAGTVFQITSSGSLTTLYSFTGGNDGEAPYAGLVQGSDGNLYGTTGVGGSGGYGTVFQITISGSLTTLYSFTGSDGGGVQPFAGLVQGSDGNFYGTTSGGGGGGGEGTIFKITTSGSLTTLYSFNVFNNDDGGFGGTGGFARLIQGSDGNFYGTTHINGSNGSGTIFKITTSGSLTTLYSFSALSSGTNTDGANSEAGLIQGSDGNFYGTTLLGGSYSEGTVFEITLKPAAATLSSTNVTATAATLTGTANPNGEDTQVWFEYGTDTTYGSRTASQDIGSGMNGVTVSGTLAGLLPDTTYHFRLDATNGVGVALGNDLTLTTLAAPAITGTAATGITASGGTLDDLVNPNGVDTTIYYQYGTTTSYGSQTPLQDIGSGTSAALASGTLSGLQPGTTYYYQLVTTSAAGTFYGADQSLTTLAAPAITGTAASEITMSGGTLDDLVNPNGVDTIIYYQYGTTTNYGSQTVSQDIGSGTGAALASGTLSGLQPNTTYHYELVTTSAAGTFYGPNQTFTTTLYTANGAVVTGTSVTFSASVNPSGLAGPSTNKTNVLVSWQYGLTQGSYTAGSTTAIPIGTGTSTVPVSFTRAKSGLKAVIYHYQIVISTTLGKIYGPDQTFSMEPPTLAYSAPTATGTDATLSMTVNPNELDTMVSIRYGLTTAYTSGTIPLGDIGSGFTPVSVDPDLTGLAPETAYYYQVVTTNALGTLYGPAQEFATQPVFGTAVELLTKQAAPGIAGATFSALGNPIINDFDQMAFQATLTGAGISTGVNNSGIWADIGTNGLTLIAQTGTSAPDYTGTSTVGTFAKLSDPVYADSDAVAFLGTLTQTGTVTTSNDAGIWATTSGTTNGPLLLVARAGDPAPDSNGATSASSPVFASFSQFVLPDQGGVVVLAKLVSGTPASPGPGGVISTNNQGIWAVDTDGLLKQVIRTGDGLTVNGRAKVISGLTIFNAPTASTGQTRHFNNAGDLTYKATFTDGSSSIVQSVFP